MSFPEKNEEFYPIRVLLLKVSGEYKNCWEDSHLDLVLDYKFYIKTCTNPSGCLYKNWATKNKWGKKISSSCLFNALYMCQFVYRNIRLLIVMHPLFVTYPDFLKIWGIQELELKLLEAYWGNQKQ